MTAKVASQYTLTELQDRKDVFKAHSILPRVSRNSLLGHPIYCLFLVPKSVMKYDFKIALPSY